MTTNQVSTDRPLVVITGSSGLVGARLIETLRQSYRVVGLDIESPESEPRPWRWIDCDLTSEPGVRFALAKLSRDCGRQIASVVHLAAYYDFSGEPSPLYRTLTVEGTRRLLEGLQAFEVEQFIFSSSLLVMKSAAEDEAVTADSPVEAEWDYPQSKLAAEQVIRRHRRKIRALVLRIAGVYDEGCHSIPLAQQISRIHQKQLESYVFPGNTSCGQSFIHLDDLAECLRAAIDGRDRLPEHEVLVIGEEDVMSYQQLQDALGELIHGKETWPTLRIPKPVAKAGAWVQDKLAGEEEEAPFIKPWMIDLADQNYPVDISRARTVLGWQPRHTLRETLPAMIGRLRDDPQHWYRTNDLPVPDDVKIQQPAGRS